ncbi:hypothetical protein DES40_1737 [Litorimonas taeanensis]|uniref:Uncharacterized protein n=1 Tax=Litorimonas taeanensis TaxID=568099 RepID=A0A420WD79_9PROT|nr:hypothetical protein [Litorimonas taeanensis]RKQ68961.1 hypothetical protein DES40_1737 [Litorimonas taeanensis]
MTSKEQKNLMKSESVAGQVALKIGREVDLLLSTANDNYDCLLSQVAAEFGGNYDQ